VGLKTGTLSSTVVTSYKLPVVTIGLWLLYHRFSSVCSNLSRTDGRTDRRTDGNGLAKGGNFIGRETVELALKLTIGSYSKALLPYSV